jgi:hypothetical protein
MQNKCFTKASQSKFNKRVTHMLDKQLNDAMPMANKSRSRIFASTVVSCRCQHDLEDSCQEFEMKLKAVEDESAPQSYGSLLLRVR